MKDIIFVILISLPIRSFSQNSDTLKLKYIDVRDERKGYYFVIITKDSIIKNKTNKSNMKQQLKETSISNDSLANKRTYGNWRVSKDGNDIETDDSAALGICSMFAYENSDNDAAFICEAVNNYNALKQSNKELIEALEQLHHACLDNDNSVNAVNWWAKHKETAAKAYHIIQKAKQL